MADSGLLTSFFALTRMWKLTANTVRRSTVSLFTWQKNNVSHYRSLRIEQILWLRRWEFSLDAARDSRIVQMSSQRVKERYRGIISLLCNRLRSSNFSLTSHKRISRSSKSPFMYRSVFRAFLWWINLWRETQRWLSWHIFYFPSRQIECVAKYSSFMDLVALERLSSLLNALENIKETTARSSGLMARPKKEWDEVSLISPVDYRSIRFRKKAEATFKKKALMLIKLLKMY